jgi:PPOX class probable FMN-dependent enzyme
MIDRARLVEVIGEPHPLVKTKIVDHLDAMAQRFIAAAPFAMLATADSEGRPDVSPRGDGPGFAHVVDPHTLLLPERPGNKLVFSMQNIIANPQVALIFLIPGVDESYRVHGRARLVEDEQLLARLEARGKPALMAIEIKVERAFLHCGKALKRSRLWAERPAGVKPFRFGEVIAKANAGGQEMEAMVDAIVADDYQNGL